MQAHTNPPPSDTPLTIGIAPVPVGEPLPVKDLTALLIKHYDLHEGNFDLLIEFQIGMGVFGPTLDAQAPGAMIGISKMGLAKSVQIGPLSVDAAMVNPAPKARPAKKR